MITADFRAEVHAKAEAIGKDSWELLRFMQLRKNAGCRAMVGALEADAKWLESHCDEVLDRIGRLCREIKDEEGME